MQHAYLFHHQGPRGHAGNTQGAVNPAKSDSPTPGELLRGPAESSVDQSLSEKAVPL